MHPCPMTLGQYDIMHLQVRPSLIDMSGSISKQGSALNPASIKAMFAGVNYSFDSLGISILEEEKFTVEYKLEVKPFSEGKM